MSGDSLKVLPFTEDELLAAILSCHRDHVAFVDNEVAGGPRWTDDAAGAQSIDPAQLPSAPLRRPIDRPSPG